jgi:transposase
MYRNPKRISNLSIDAYNKMRSKLKHTISYQKFCVLKNLAANSIGNTDEVLNLELDSLLALHLFLNAQIEAMEKKIIEIYQSLAYKVHSIRGVGLDSAAIIASEIGNFSRFASAHQLLALTQVSRNRASLKVREKWSNTDHPT